MKTAILALRLILNEILRSELGIPAQMGLRAESPGACAPGEAEMSKVVIALFLGITGLCIGFAVGEGSGLVAGFVTLGVYCFVCQFLLSRKNANAYRQDRPVMLSLDAAWLYILGVMFLKERQNVIHSQGSDSTRHLRSHLSWRGRGVSDCKTNFLIFASG